MRNKCSSKLQWETKPSLLQHSEELENISMTVVLFIFYFDSVSLLETDLKELELPIFILFFFKVFLFNFHLLLFVVLLMYVLPLTLKRYFMLFEDYVLSYAAKPPSIKTAKFFTDLAEDIRITKVVSSTYCFMLIQVLYWRFKCRTDQNLSEEFDQQEQIETHLSYIC